MSPIPVNHPPVPLPRIGVLLVNLGTPDAADARAVRRYLKQFLSDKRVVELPSLLWQPILRGAILRTRPRKSARAYAQVWTPEGSPLLALTRRQAFALDARFGGDVTVAFAMRYGQPAIAEVLSAMQAKGCERILIAPLYPQYCAATTATANDAAFAALADMRWQPALRTLPPYYDDPAYIDALTGEIERALAALSFQPRAILASFHGMPQRTLEKGDPYHCHCQKTARLLAERLSIPLTISFQSRFGRAKWLEPATDAMLAQLASEGVNDVAVVAPGFSVDCLETLEELAIRGREQFLDAGGRNFAYLPCLNASDAGLDMLDTIVCGELAGWIA